MIISILTLGCSKNEADSDYLKGKLIEKGHQISSNLQKTDLVIVYTCGFIHDAKEESINEIFRMISYKKDIRDLKIVAVGCLIQRYYEEFKREIPEIDGLIGVESAEKIAELITNEDYFYFSNGMNSVCEFTLREISSSHVYLKVGDGCNRNCAFCSIPSFKGKSVSRKIEDILNESIFLIKSGVKEIILVSQDITQYGLDLRNGSSLPLLLKKLNDVEGDFWIRVLYLHPDHIGEEIIKAMISLPKVINYFDIPIQSGSNKILKKMKRIKSTYQLKNIFNLIRDNSDDSVLRTTVMVGFPGENEDTFKETVDFIKDVRFDHLGGFTYSKEENTASFNMEETMNSDRAKELLNGLLEIQENISRDFLENMVGRDYKVLLEKDDEDIFARSYAFAPDIDNTIYIKRGFFKRDFVKCRVTGIFENQLEGEII